MTSLKEDKPFTLKGVHDLDGSFKRVQSTFRDWVKADGSTPFTPDAGRYTLYISYACPWASGANAVRILKGLDHAIDLVVVHHHLTAVGWHFDTTDSPGATGDTVNGKDTLREVYELAQPEFDGRVTVPVLWDKQQNTIVNNESIEIMKMFNSEFNSLAKNPNLDLYPEARQPEIDSINEWVYHNINNGVYKCGFAAKQAAYDQAFDALFDHLDKAESILAKQRYLTGDHLTLVDLRLFKTLVRFDPVYVVHFKTNLRRIYDYPNLWNFTKDIYQHAGMKETVDMFHIKTHYYASHTNINPYGIVPKGPEIDYTTPHDRDRFPSA